MIVRDDRESYRVVLSWLIERGRFDGSLPSLSALRAQWNNPHVD
jgi:hypothetical protein